MKNHNNHMQLDKSSNTRSYAADAGDRFIKMTMQISEPLLGDPAELIVEDHVAADDLLYRRILSEVGSMNDAVRNSILSAMLKMHNDLKDKVGDLDVSLNSVEEIADNTEGWYVILDDESSHHQRIVRYHYRANWETCRGVEIIIVNGDEVVFVGNCGYARSVEELRSGKCSAYNYK